jgi:hypothetical protein
MTAVVRSADLTSAAPVNGRSHGRTLATLLVIQQRDALLVEAAKFFPDASDLEIARRLRSALTIYRAGRWQHRDRAEATCPPQHRGKLTQTMWLILKVHDHVPCIRTVTAALARARA